MNDESGQMQILYLVPWILKNMAGSCFEKKFEPSKNAMQMGCKEKNRFIDHLLRESWILNVVFQMLLLLLLSNSFTDPGAAEKY